MIQQQIEITINKSIKDISEFLQLKLNEYQIKAKDLHNRKREELLRLQQEGKELTLNDFLFDSTVELTGFLNDLERDIDDLRYLINCEYTKLSGKEL